jgi:hypothetical protein
LFANEYLYKHSLDRSILNTHIVHIKPVRLLGAAILAGKGPPGPKEKIMSAFPRPLRNVAANVALALGWPARVIEARETRARLAELSERERQDIGGVRQEGADQPVDETPEEWRARLRAIHAWYGHGRDARAA